jgi:hypothetical protein
MYKRTSIGGPLPAQRPEGGEVKLIMKDFFCYVCDGRRMHKKVEDVFVENDKTYQLYRCNGCDVLHNSGELVDKKQHFDQLKNKMEVG